MMMRLKWQHHLEIKDIFTNKFAQSTANPLRNIAADELVR